ncbi:glycosyltransferase family 2 protein [Roseomonas eburnea]|uniref:Glycosyltransferase family 2 protein n=1 Tax=Neoroseomonas eburnea TaxID=1346889 RepID=A0A9X9XJB4_9PROT|nr:glycosyltransferase family 2 protein [Neoroseomonas eburnea]MBR0683800.1 glycosyltransferase family 2 protein [Neoroseomonas eburnea]
MKIAAVTSVRNEAPFLLEWVIYNRLIGFTDIVVYYNDCSDGTDLVAHALADAGLITAIENKGLPDVAPQVAAFVQARSIEQVRTADWAIAIDVDEFINIKCGEGTLSDLFAAIPDADAVLMQMRHFGSSHHIFMQDDLVLRQFSLASTEDHPDNAIVKTLHRMGRRFKTIGMHMPFFFERYDEKPRIYNGSGKLVPEEMHRFERGRKVPEGWAGMDLVQLNHYAVRSLDQFLVKRRRGSGTGMRNRFSKEYWLQRDANDVVETSILRMLPRLEQEVGDVLRLARVKDAVMRARRRNEIEVMLSIRDAPPFAFEVAKSKMDMA